MRCPPTPNNNFFLRELFLRFLASCYLLALNFFSEFLSLSLSYYIYILFFGALINRDKSQVQEPSNRRRASQDGAFPAVGRQGA